VPFAPLAAGNLVRRDARQPLARNRSLFPVIRVAYPLLWQMRGRQPACGRYRCGYGPAWLAGWPFDGGVFLAGSQALPLAWRS